MCHIKDSPWNLYGERYSFLNQEMRKKLWEQWFNQPHMLNSCLRTEALRLSCPFKTQGRINKSCQQMMFQECRLESLPSFPTAAARWTDQNLTAAWKREETHPDRPADPWAKKMTVCCCCKQSKQPKLTDKACMSYISLFMHLYTCQDLVDTWITSLDLLSPCDLRQPTQSTRNKQNWL